MSALARIEAWIEEAEAILRMLDGHDLAESAVAIRVATLRDARDLFAPEYEEAAEELEEDAQDSAQDPEDLPDQFEVADVLADTLPEDPAPAEASPPPTPPRVAPSARAPESGQPEQAAPSPSMTEARRALLREIWMDVTLRGDDILRRINDLPGEHVSTFEALRHHARKMGLPTNRRAIIAADPLAGIPDDELAEAREMLANPSNGARHLAEYFGWDLPRAQEIAAAIRAEAKAAAA